ncbi:MAG: hypothetical protein IJH25_08440 [Clostridia bacterium]|nr:hypothetical protein [Clostridia bacterium]MBQ6121550.1 hypothetical protein [Clostridia bacterium]
MGKRQSVSDIIKAAAREGARETVHLQRQQRNLNLYRTTERLLRNYKKYQRLVTDLEGYGFEPVEKSHSISVAPPPGSGVADRVDLYDEHVAARRASYERTKARYDEIDAVVRLFQDREEFIVIRMYYFNEDAWGQDRGEDAKPYTFDEISEELAAIGIERSERSLRTWRTKLVQDMTVLLFGVDGAVSIEAREPKQGQPEEGGNDGQLRGTE